MPATSTNWNGRSTTPCWRAFRCRATAYFYENPLEAGKDRRRWSWHGCPCCPPMFLKIMGAMPGYIYAQDEAGIYVNLFVGSRAEVRLPAGKVVLRQTTQYPWQGDVKIAVEPEQPAEFDLSIRIPGWCQGASSPDDLYQVVGRPASGAARLKVNGQAVENLDMVRGYARLRRNVETRRRRSSWRWTCRCGA